MHPSEHGAHTSGASRSRRRRRETIGGKVQRWLFEGLTAITTLPVTIAGLFRASKPRASSRNHGHAPSSHDAQRYAVPASSAADIVARANALQQEHRPAPAFNNPEAATAGGGLIGLTRKNPHMGLLIAGLIMGIVQITLVGLLIFMMRDAGYSSGWGDATKYYIQCEKSSQLQQFGQ